MAEYIDKEALLHKIRWADDAEDCIMTVCRMPAMNVALVKHARWEGSGQDVRCPECGCHPLKEMNMDIIHYWKYEPPYCPNCGAKMYTEEE